MQLSHPFPERQDDADQCTGSGTHTLFTNGTPTTCLTSTTSPTPVSESSSSNSTQFTTQSSASTSSISISSATGSLHSTGPSELPNSTTTGPSMSSASIPTSNPTLTGLPVTTVLNPSFSSTNPQATPSAAPTAAPHTTTPSSRIASSFTPPPRQPLARPPQSHVGPIVGGVIGGLAFLTLALFAILYRKRLARRLKSHRTAPSAEFRGHTPFSPRPPGMRADSRLQVSSMYGTMSRNGSPSPFFTRDYVSRQPIYRDDDTVGDLATSDESSGGLPPPFTPGTFNNPIYEKLQAAERQREEAVAHSNSLEMSREGPYSYPGPMLNAMPEPEPARAFATGGEQLYNPYDDEENEGNMQVTSPILSSGHGHRASSDFRKAMEPDEIGLAM